MNEEALWSALVDVKDELMNVRQRVGRLENEVRELRSLVTPLDPGSLPVPQGGNADGS